MRADPRRGNPVRIRRWIGLPQICELNASASLGAGLVRIQQPVAKPKSRDSTHKLDAAILAEQRSIRGPREGQLREVLASIFESHCSWLS